MSETACASGRLYEGLLIEKECFMTKKICAMLLLSLAVSACESNPAETNSKATNANANAPAQASPSASQTVAPSPTAEQTPSPASQLKAGDKVKIMVKGAATEATVVSVDEKLGKATVKVQGESKERTVAITDITRQ
jgi:glucose/arabinose dehydrogenase